jgi:hypothetical protein
MSSKRESEHTSIHTPDYTQPNDTVPELQAYDAQHMGGLTVHRCSWENGMADAEEEDTPQVDQSIWLRERPGELAPEALRTPIQGEDDDPLHPESGQSQALKRAYDIEQLKSRRERHLGLLDSGLEQGDR